MNRTVRNLIVAAPLATIALTLAPISAATAGPNGPVIIVQPKGDPQPPKGPKDIKDAPKPKGPQDKAPLPKPKPKDKAPKPAAKPKPKADTQVAAQVTARTIKADVAVAVTPVEVVSAKGSPDSIDRSDSLFAGEPFETALVASDDASLDLTWLLLGGGIVTASGIAFAARRRSRS